MAETENLQILEGVLEDNYEEQKVEKTPYQQKKRMSALEMEHEKTELKNLLKEKYIIPMNSGTLPMAKYN